MRRLRREVACVEGELCESACTIHTISSTLLDVNNKAFARQELVLAAVIIVKIKIEGS